MRTTLNVICESVCEHFNLEQKELFKDSRKLEYSYPRHLYHYLATKYTIETLSDIGNYGFKYFSEKSRNHATVINSNQRINGFIYTQDKNTIHDLTILEKSILKNSYLDNKIIPLHFNLVEKCINHTQSFI